MSERAMVKSIVVALSLVACTSGPVVSLSGSASGASAAGPQPKVVNLQGHGTATGGAGQAKATK